jgi:ABC-type bacteriocin/lantibiotic exporter with double-glycine peptidase domain
MCPQRAVMPPALKPPGLRLLLPLLLCAGCVSGGRRLALDVPPIAYEGDRCGIAALQAVLEFMGTAADQDELAREAFIPALGGTTPHLLAEAARARGLEADVREGSLALLEQWLKAGIPPIVFLGPEPAQPKGHFAVVAGITTNRKSVWLQSGGAPAQWIPWETVAPRWKRGGSLSVLVRPPVEHRPPVSEKL